MAETCFSCGSLVDEGERLVLVRGKRQQAHCSDACVRATLRRERMATNAWRRRWLLRVCVPALVVVSGWTLWQRHRAPPRRTISHAWPEALPRADPLPKPIPFGPPWPPPDSQWIAVFDQASWVFPLPGPARRAATADGRIFGPEAPRDLPAQCRTSGHCGVDLGGELWGEHVYAALDGVVERVVQGDGKGRGGTSVRLAHVGGQVFTQYFHLAATPRRLYRGAHVKAGDVIGLVGDSGLEGARRHLCFALSVRPSSELPEVYWDPAPWMDSWPLRQPPRGTVAGLAPAAPGAIAASPSPRP